MSERALSTLRKKQYRVTQRDRYRRSTFISQYTRNGNYGKHHLKKTTTREPAESVALQRKQQLALQRKQQLALQRKQQHILITRYSLTLN